MNPFWFMAVLNFIGFVAMLVLWKRCFGDREWSDPYTSRDGRLIGYVMVLVFALQVALFGAAMYGLGMR